MNTKDTKGRRKPDPKRASRKPAAQRPANKQTKRQPDPRQAKESVAAKSRKHRAAAAKRPPKRKPLDTEIVYTQAKPFAVSTFLIHLVTVVAVVAAVILGMSIFFKVGVVNVSGSEKYTAWDIKEASGIQEGENLLTMNKGRAVGKIKAALPYVDEVRIGIELPKTVNIEITELAVTYAIATPDNDWWLMDSEGQILEPLARLEEKKYTQILGITVTEPAMGQQAVATEPEPETIDVTDASGETVNMTVPVTIQGKERLDTVLLILQQLEENGILGQMASVDVTDLSDMVLWYGDRYRIELGDTTQLSRKIRSAKLAIDQMSEYQTGVLDVSFTIWPDQVGYTSFDQE